MTDHDDTFNPLDELASAHLDGQTTAEEAARIAADPVVAARVELLQTARTALRGAGEPVDATRRDAAIAAALAAFDEGAPDTVGAAAPASPLTRRRVRVPARPLRLVGIAAAVLLLALAVPVLGRLVSDSDNDDLATSALDEGDASSGREAADSAGGAEATTTAPSAFGAPASATPALGSFRDLSGLADAVRSQLGGSDAAVREESSPMAATTDGTAVQDCVAVQRPTDAATIYVATAELDGQPVIVLVRDEPDGGRSLLVLDRDCTTVSARPL